MINKNPEYQLRGDEKRSEQILQKQKCCLIYSTSLGINK